MSEYRKYRRTQIAEMADWEPWFNMTGVSISVPDMRDGSPKAGDKIARNPANHADKWLVAAAYFAANFEAIGERPCERCGGVGAVQETDLDNRPTWTEDPCQACGGSGIAQ